jgi:hypothetical protein
MLTHGRRVAARLGDMEKGTWTMIPSLCRVNCLFYKQLLEFVQKPLGAYIEH